MEMELLAAIAHSLEKGDADSVAELTSQAIAERLGAATILNQGLIAGMAVVGEQFKRHDIFLPDVLLAARAMQGGIDLLKPLLLDEEVPSLGKVVIGSSRGDLHDIGKNLVGIMLKGAGFEVVDLGSDVPAERFVDTAVAEQAQLIGMSALLTTTMSAMKEVVEMVRQRDLCIKTMIGGAPVTQEYAREIGADAYGYDAANAVETAKLLLGVS